MVNKLSLMGRYRKVVLRNKRSGSDCPIALHHPQQAVGALDVYKRQGQMYPLNLYTKWNRNNYGPIWIPAKGATITLTEDNLPLYCLLYTSRCV